MTSQIRTSFKVTTMVAAAFLVLVYLTYFLVRQDAISDLRAESQAKLNYFSAAVFAPTDKYTYLPGLVAGNDIISDALTHPSDRATIQATNLLLRNLNEQAGSAAIYVMDVHGNTIASSNSHMPTSFIGKNYGFRPYFQDALRSGMGKFYGVGTSSNLPGYYIAHGLKRNGEILGVVAVKIDLLDLHVGWDKGNFVMAVADKNGVLFLSTKPEWAYRPVQALDQAAIADMQRTRQFESLLKPALPMEVVKQLSATEKIVSIPEHPDVADSEKRSYVLNSAPLKGSEWSVYLFKPTDGIEARSAFAAGIAAIAFGLLGMLALYLIQRRQHYRERDKSRAELELAHQQLEQKHSELQVMNAELHRASITDPLTGAYNRRFFVEESAKLVSMAHRQNLPLSIVTIDVDHFKKINDEHGHAAGDKVLIELANLYRSEMRPYDIFARMGGEEFVMALHNADAQAAFQVGERLRHRVMSSPIELSDQHISVTVSCGVSEYWPEEATIEQAMVRADKALYSAKRQGRNRVCMPEPEIPVQSHH